MPVIKTLRACYEVRDGQRCGEWANITLRCWDNPPHAGTSRTEMYYCGEIVIHSSHGNWANTWTACGEPFKRFLLDVEFDYIFGNLSTGQKAGKPTRGSGLFPSVNPTPEEWAGEVYGGRKPHNAIAAKEQ